jgi:hypothetical protein
MRARFVLLLVAILLVAGFAALNAQEIMRPSQLNFGIFQTEAPMGAILLGLLAVALLVFLASAAASAARMRAFETRYHRDLQAQRDLAEREEASRFTQLRQHFDDQLAATRLRDPIVSTEFERNMIQSQRELRQQLEHLHHTLATRLGELENRMDARLERLGTPALDVARRPVDVELGPRDRVKV